jgi:hypothetical protein
MFMTHKLTSVTIACLLLVLSADREARAQGHFEFGAHIGSWSLNLLKPVLEAAANKMAEQIKNKELDSIRASNPSANLREISSKINVQFDSNGSNAGFEVRWFPQALDGSFSIGLAAEQSTLRVGLPKVTTTLAMEDTKNHQPWSYAGSASGEVASTPLAVILSFRWEIASTAWLHPYVTIGLGAAGISAWDSTSLAYEFNGTLNGPNGLKATITETSRKTLYQLKKEDEQRQANGELKPGDKPFEYPMNVFPFAQVNVGFKARVARIVYVLVDGGVFDGFLVRGGVSIRP